MENDWRPVVPHWAHVAAEAEGYPRDAYRCLGCDLAPRLDVDLTDRSLPTVSYAWRPELVPA